MELFVFYKSCCAVQPTPVLLPEKSHGRRSLVGCSPWGREESDMTEQLPFHFHALEKAMATHSSVLAWRIPGTGAWWAAVCGVAQSCTRLSSSSSMSIESVMPSNRLILCRPLLLRPSVFPSIRVFSNESVLHIRWLNTRLLCV